MTFIQTPVIDNGNIHEIEFFQGNPESFNGSFERRRVGLVERESPLAQKDTTFVGFNFAIVGQGTIHPSRKLEVMIKEEGKTSIQYYYKRIPQAISRPPYT